MNMIVLNLLYTKKQKILINNIIMIELIHNIIYIIYKSIVN